MTTLSRRSLRMSRSGTSRLSTSLRALALALCATAFAAHADVPLPAAAKARGATVEAKGPAPKHLRIAVLTYQGSSFWQQMEDGTQAAIAYLKPLNTDVVEVPLGTNLSAEVFDAGLDGVIAKQFNGAIGVPIFDGTVSKVNEAVDGGIPFYSVIADSNAHSKRGVSMGMQAYDAGHAAGDFIAKQIGGEGKVVVITGVLGAAQHDARMNGAMDLWKKSYPKIKIIGPFESKDDAATVYSQATDAISGNPDLKVIYVTANGSEAAAKAVKDAKATGHIGVVGYDDLPEKAQYKQDGEILALLDQAPYRQVFDAVVMMHNQLAFGAKYPSDIVIPSPVAYGKYAHH
ncbi:sugar ABC transporter substrate-binding protein [Pararobbsia silviterrae]|nr:sugar ABC transporter substrate-binding protein [Pararobbsia silviterrae]